MKGTRTSLAFFLMSTFLAVSARAQTSAFSFQGKLRADLFPANGAYDMQFRLFDAASEGAQVGATLTLAGVNTIDGVFSVSLDFGAGAFSGGARFLEIGVSPAGTGEFTTLAPRQKINAVPYSVKASSAATADVSTDSLNLGGVAASSYVQTFDARLSDARVPLPGSNDYVQNTNAAQASANFNIGGTGTANVLNAQTQYNLGGARILSVAGTSNLFVGLSSGAANTTGAFNTFSGAFSGSLNQTGSGNSFFGAETGRDNTTGSSNSFFGVSSGRANTTGTANSFFGRDAGVANTTGIQNTFVGSQAGNRNTTGIQNSFVGDNAALDNTTGSQNVAIGSGAGQGNVSGSRNIFIGRLAQVGTTTPINDSVAIGTSAIVSQSNTIVLGTSFQTTRVMGKLVAGLTNPNQAPLTGSGAGYFETWRISSSFGGILAENLILSRLLSNGTSNSSPICFRSQTVGSTGGYLLVRCASNFASVADKTEIKPFAGGIEILKRLDPVAFRWKESGAGNVGLNVEDLAEIAPALVRRDETGAVEKISESGLIVLLINSVKQQNAQIEAQKKQIDALKRLVCAANREVEICKEER